MAVGDLSYRAAVNLTVTALASIATSATWVAGWASALIDNTSDLDDDKYVSAQFTLAAAGLAAGEVRVYVFAMLDDTNWPDLFSSGTEGSQGTATVHDTEQRDSGLIPLWNTFTDTDASGVYSMPKQSIAAAFGGYLPPKFALFVTHSTGANLAASGQQITVQGVKRLTA
jgi:hypothetical protein